MPQVRDPKTGRYTSGGGSSVGGAAGTNPRIQKAKAVGAGAPAGGSEGMVTAEGKTFPKSGYVMEVRHNGSYSYVLSPTTKVSDTKKIYSQNTGADTSKGYFNAIKRSNKVSAEKVKDTVINVPSNYKTSP